MNLYLLSVRNELCDMTFKSQTIFIYVKRYAVIMTFISWRSLVKMKIKWEMWSLKFILFSHKMAENACILKDQLQPYIRNSVCDSKELLSVSVLDNTLSYQYMYSSVLLKWLIETRYYIFLPDGFVSDSSVVRKMTELNRLAVTISMTSTTSHVIRTKEVTVWLLPNEQF